MGFYGDMRTGRHRVFVRHAHLVFLTRDQHLVITAAHLERVEERDVCADSGTGLAEFNGEANHVHLLVDFPPNTALFRLVNSLKGVRHYIDQQDRLSRPAHVRPSSPPA